MSSFLLKRPFTIPILFFLIHAAVVVYFAVNNVPLGEPGKSESSMVWGLWMAVDLPLGIVALFAAEITTTNVAAISCIIVIGGLQWVFWGWLLYKFGKYQEANPHNRARW